MSFPSDKYEHHTFESIIHTGFLESLDRCSQSKDLEFDTPQFVECVKVSGINYASFIKKWICHKN